MATDAFLAVIAQSQDPARLVMADASLNAVIEARGDRPYLHVRSDDAGAIGVYERLGFLTRPAAGDLPDHPPDKA